ncbi:MAG: hypothetical protein LRZ93_05125 [Clostridiales bacterium]|nr:hypothetical protein [Clostridiales bacterium]
MSRILKVLILLLATSRLITKPGLSTVTVTIIVVITIIVISYILWFQNKSDHEEGK